MMHSSYAAMAPSHRKSDVCREQEAEEKRRDKKRQKKNLGLLSFGEEAGEEEAGNAADTETRIGSVFEAANDEDPRSAIEHQTAS